MVDLRHTSIVWLFGLWSVDFLRMMSVPSGIGHRCTAYAFKALNPSAGWLQVCNLYGHYIAEEASRLKDVGWMEVPITFHKAPVETASGADGWVCKKRVLAGCISDASRVSNPALCGATTSTATTTTTVLTTTTPATTTTATTARLVVVHSRNLAVFIGCAKAPPDPSTHVDVASASTHLAVADCRAKALRANATRFGVMAATINTGAGMVRRCILLGLKSSRTAYLVAEQRQQRDCGTPPPPPPPPATCPGMDSNYLQNQFCVNCQGSGAKGMCVGEDPTFCCGGTYPDDFIGPAFACTKCRSGSIPCDSDKVCSVPARVPPPSTDVYGQPLGSVDFMAVYATTTRLVPTAKGDVLMQGRASHCQLGARVCERILAAQSFTAAVDVDQQLQTREVATGLEGNVACETLCANHVNCTYFAVQAICGRTTCRLLSDGGKGTSSIPESAPRNNTGAYYGMCGHVQVCNNHTEKGLVGPTTTPNRGSTAPVGGFTDASATTLHPKHSSRGNTVAAAVSSAAADAPLTAGSPETDGNSGSKQGAVMTSTTATDNGGGGGNGKETAPSTGTLVAGIVCAFVFVAAGVVCVAVCRRRARDHKPHTVQLRGRGAKQAAAAAAELDGSNRFSMIPNAIHSVPHRVSTLVRETALDVHAQTMLPGTVRTSTTSLDDAPIIVAHTHDYGVPLTTAPEGLVRGGSEPAEYVDDVPGVRPPQEAGLYGEPLTTEYTASRAGAGADLPYEIPVEGRTPRYGAPLTQAYVASGSGGSVAGDHWYAKPLTEEVVYGDVVYAVPVGGLDTYSASAVGSSDIYSVPATSATTTTTATTATATATATATTTATTAATTTTTTATAAGAETSTDRTARQPQIINQNGPTSGFELCFAPNQNTSRIRH